MNESEFISRIDCNFPYYDHQEASRLIDLSCQISTNAVFMVAFELACPPFRKMKSTKIVRLDLLNELDQKFEHPIKSMIFSICRKMIRGQRVTGDEALEALDNLKDYQDQYCAASIAAGYAYFNSDEESYDELIEARHEELIQLWKIRGG